MRHVLKTRVVLANSTHARWVERTGAGFADTAEFSAEPSTGHHQMATVYESAAPMRHGAGAVDLKARSREKFAAEIAHRLNSEASKGDFEQLALVAPPKMLLAVRQALSPAARAKIVLELSKDLVKTPAHELGDWLSLLTLPRSTTPENQPHR